MRKPILFLFWIILTNTWATAQPVSTLLKNAEQEAETGHFFAAAELWERAGRLKGADPELLYKAAEAYARVRDYHRAADCYQVASSSDQKPLAPLRHARALKQQGRYGEAVEAFEAFAQGYRGEHKAVLMAVAENEIAGCELSIQFFENQDSTVMAQHLPDSVNTDENELCPRPYTDNLLYFSRASGDSSQLLRTLRNVESLGGGWKPPSESSLPETAAQQFKRGQFSFRNAYLFFYTECDEPCNAARGGGVRPASCAIYCVRRTEEGWGVPERLPAYINLEGSTSMFPHVASGADVEYLFFSSDRPGGFGGLDLYVCERPRDSETLDFSLPKNLGRLVNTGADEVTPVYDDDSKTLWFSSLGHPSLGGMDIFKTEQSGESWSKPQNLGPPFNSPADDCFFVLKKNGTGAFLTSNRRVDETKTTTTDDDIFELRW